MLTPSQLINVRCLMKAARARRREAANRAADARDARAMLLREQDRANFRSIAGTPRNMIYPADFAQGV